VKAKKTAKKTFEMSPALTQRKHRENTEKTQRKHRENTENGLPAEAPSCFFFAHLSGPASLRRKHPFRTASELAAPPFLVNFYNF
jgi:hypothetical protein